MPTAAPTPCRHPGCAVVLTTPGYCDTHRRATRKQQDERRGSAAARGYGARWRKARASYLSRHPLCAECERLGRLTAATVVDHIVPHRGNRELFWDERNWQALCKPCHDAKTAREDGGFGNASDR
ncbi:transglycosylase [Burkholderiales bacterium GJ-E10]|nr:transglycosylase [Burkholderiales bacterium GJ-E10]